MVTNTHAFAEGHPRRLRVCRCLRNRLEIRLGVTKIPGMKLLILALGLFALGSGRSVAEEGTDTNAVMVVVRAFLVGAMTLEVEAVKRHALPHPELTLLGEGTRPPPAVRRQMREVIGRAVFRFLKEGDRVRLPGGGTLVVSGSAVVPGRRLVRPVIGGDAMPVPLAVIRTDAGWKVDATPIIAARKAATQRR